MVLYNNEPMSAHTTFKVGGPVKNFITVDSEEDLREAIKSYPDYYIIGNGSNLIVSDEGYDGTVLISSLTYKFYFILKYKTVNFIHCLIHKNISIPYY